jgi:hypothetical protein
MRNGRPFVNRSPDVVPAAITRQYPGKCIVYSEDVQRIIGIGDTEDEAFDQAEASGVQGLWHVHFAAADDAEDL